MVPLRECTVPESFIVVKQRGVPLRESTVPEAFYFRQRKVPLRESTVPEAFIVVSSPPPGILDSSPGPCYFLPLIQASAETGKQGSLSYSTEDGKPGKNRDF